MQFTPAMQLKSNPSLDPLGIFTLHSNKLTQFTNCFVGQFCGGVPKETLPLKDKVGVYFKVSLG
jgi:hypothetical protein